MADVTLLAAPAGSTANATSYAALSGAFSPTVGRLIVAIVTATATTDAAPTLVESAGGGSYTLVHTNVWSASANRQYIFIRNSLTEANTSRSLTFACAADAATGAAIHVHEVSGVTRSGASAKRAISSNRGQTSVPTSGAWDISTDTNNPTILALASATSNPPPSTAPTNWTSLSTAGGYATPTTGISSCKRASGYASTASLSWITSDANNWGTIGIEIDSSSAGVSGTGTPTLAEFTLAAAGTVAVQGSGSPSLGTLTLSATGTVPRTGTGSPTLAALSLSAAGTVAVQGTLSQILAAFTLSSAGTVASSGINGTGSPVLAAFTLSAAGTVPRTGSGTPTLAAFTLSAAGTVPRTGTGSPTLAAFTLASSGAVAIAGTGAPSLASFALAAAGAVGSVPISGTGTPVLAVFALAATGTSGGVVDSKVYVTATAGNKPIYDPTFYPHTMNL